MKYLEINSPYSGQPVKVREVDIQRAVRDQDGRVFYVLLRSDGKGYYGSITRSGGRKEEQQYLAMEAKQARATEVGQERSAAQIQAAATARRRSARGKLVILVLLLAALAVVALWLFTGGPLGHVKWQAPPPPSSMPQR